MLVQILANVNYIHDDPQPPVGNVLARLPPIGYQAVTHEHGVQIRQCSMKALGQCSQQKTAGQSQDQRSCHAWQRKWYYAYLALLAHSPPPIPPSVDRENHKEDLQQCIGEESSAEEHHHINKDRYQHYRPADEQPARSEPDA